MSTSDQQPSVDSIEHWQERGQSPTGPTRRKLSFHPTDEWTTPVAHEESTGGASEVSDVKRILQICIAVLYCLLAAGVIFGFAALKPVLVEEGVYRDGCTAREVEEGVWVCYEQELRLNLMFTVAAVSTNVCALPVGTILDRYGPRVASIIGVVFLAFGALSMAFAADLPFDAYIPGYLFLALGGPFVFISSFQLSNTFPKRSGLILALLTGAFDTSSAVFLVYRLIYQASRGSFTLRKFFLVYLAVPAFVLIAQVFVMPGQSYKTVGELVRQRGESDNSRDAPMQSTDAQALPHQHSTSDPSENTTLLGSEANDKQAQQEEEKARKSGVWGALHGRTATQQIMSPWFLLITLFTLLQMTRINYLVATIRTQYTEMLHSHHQAVQINDFFDVALPLGGVVAVPLIGLVLDYTSTPFVLGLLVAIATAIGVLGVIPETWAAYANVCLFVIYRPFFYTAVSDYAAKVFGFDTFGKVYGLIICLAGLFNFSQAGLDALTHRSFNNDPVPVNVALLIVILVVGAALVGYVTRRSYTMHRDNLEQEAEEAREVLIPGADEAQVDRPHGHETYGTA